MPLGRKSFYLNFELKKKDFMIITYDMICQILFFLLVPLNFLQDLKESRNVNAAIRNIKPISWISIEIWLQFLLPISDLN